MTALLLHSFTSKRGPTLMHLSLVQLFGAIASLKFYRFALLSVGVVSTALLLGCDRLLAPESAWETYRNSRYGFEFLYPKDWIAEPPPDNQDGQVFRAPDRPGVKVAGWASQIPATSGEVTEGEATEPDKILPDPIKENFVTEQGLPGELEVQIAAETSSLNLTLEHEGVIYRWQGRSPSQQFEDYYKFFSYVASHYRVLSATEP
ncbi:hypothetical protein [Leptolyngbya sp. FACHB-671]|uniref:hypothetical protein n=1 Tax=Leptolyngbya sp. FACHB-671 TaxID=2692812 RepID=UPI0018EF4B9E|nr:hypothetical protein [Leptolyngbya sp. FACHB-671]